MNEYADQAKGSREVAPRHLTPLSRTDALRLLGGVSLGRIVFTHQALPAVRPVNHCLDGDDVIVGLHDGTTLASLTAPSEGPGLVVAYEADVIDAETHLGWSVVVTGYARLVTHPDQLDHYRSVLRPWVTGAMQHALRIQPDIVTGLRLTVQPWTATPAPLNGTPGTAAANSPSA
ncbi:pyridoxamine 5'-phosphate oxidase family protein [Streptomyces sp. NPDC018029]|uniref:pyridoxamine 5'-phosphate oxidase family protein n=1 Tax=Streptomyces sp. NPDC018029 TaxID=3365032 RepID=UPI0037A9BA84